MVERWMGRTTSALRTGVACVCAFAAALGVSSPLTLDAFPLEDEFSYAIKFTDETTSQASTGDVVTMRNANGKAFSCSLPSTLTSAQMRERRADERVALVQERIPALSGPCVSKRIDYWSYEVCHASHVTQFHSEPHAPEKRATEFSLGRADADGKGDVRADGAGSLEFAVSFLRDGTDGRTSVVRYVCEPPGMVPGLTMDITAVSEVAPRQYEIIIGVRDEAVCGELVSVSRLLSPLNQTCVRHSAGWWTYQICTGGRITQYHEEDGKMLVSTLLGEYDWRAGEVLDAKPVGESPAILQRFTGGTPCSELSGGKRSATIRFECKSASGFENTNVSELSLVSVSEPSTCVYKIIVAAASLCDHPALTAGRSKGSNKPVQPIVCTPAGQGPRTIE